MLSDLLAEFWQSSRKRERAFNDFGNSSLYKIVRNLLAVAWCSLSKFFISSTSVATLRFSAELYNSCHRSSLSLLDHRCGIKLISIQIIFMCFSIYVCISVILMFFNHIIVFICSIEGCNCPCIILFPPSGWFPRYLSSPIFLLYFSSPSIVAESSSQFLSMINKHSASELPVNLSKI